MSYIYIYAPFSWIVDGFYPKFMSVMLYFLPLALLNKTNTCRYKLAVLSKNRRPSLVSWEYGFAPGFIEQHLWWLKRPIFKWQSLSHLSHLKFVLGSATVSMAFLIFLFSTCHVFRVFSACMIFSGKYTPGKIYGNIPSLNA